METKSKPEDSPYYGQYQAAAKALYSIGATKSTLNLRNGLEQNYVYLAIKVGFTGKGKGWVK